MKLKRRKVWTKKKFKNSLQKHHKDFLKTKEISSKFNYSYLNKVDSKLIAAIEGQKISWKELLILSDLDPDCHMAQFKYGISKDEKEKNFKVLIQAYISKYGIENLNDANINSAKSIDIPINNLKSKKKFICEADGCSRFQITARSIYRFGVRNFGSWKKAVNFCGIDYENKVLRRVSSFDLESVINNFDQWDKKNKSKWIINDLKENYALYQQINNSFRGQERQVPFSKLYKDNVFVFWMQLIYFRETGKLDGNRKWWDSNLKKSLKDYESNHQGNERWNEEKIIEGLQTIYSRGPGKSRLSRFFVEKNKYKEDVTVWAAMRQKRFKEINKIEEEWLKDAGFIPHKLKALYQDYDKQYSFHQCADMFAKLMKESIENQENRLSREYCSAYHPEFCNFMLLEHKSWEAALKKFGIDPKFYGINASKSAKRGLLFQEFVREMLVSNSMQEVKRKPEAGEFIYNKSIKTCKHKPKCRPDFYFEDLIIDTKISYHASTKKEQMERYFDHSGRVVVLVLNGKSRKEAINKIGIEVITFNDFLSTSMSIIGVKLSTALGSELTKALKRTPFWK